MKLLSHALAFLIIAAVPKIFNAQNQALSFDGTDDSAISFPQSGAHNFNKFSIETWVKPADAAPDSSDAFASVVSGGQPLLWLWFDRAGVQFGANSIVLGFFDGSASQNFTFVHDFVPDVWKHLAVVFNGATSPKTLQLFIDGTLQATFNPTANPSATLSNPRVQLGKLSGANPPAGHFLAGSLDDVRIWKTTRTAAQISSNRNKELAGTDANLWNYYKFNNASSCGKYDCAGGDQSLVFFGSSGGQNLPQFVAGQALTANATCSPTGCQDPISGTFTIGGASPDYADFQSAFDDLHLRGTNGQVVFNVRPGVYDGDVMSESVRIFNVETDSVLFRKEPGTSGAVIVSSDAWGFLLNRSDNVCFENLKFERVNVNTNELVWLDSCTNMSFKNCQFSLPNSSTHLKVTGFSESLSVRNCKFDFGSIGAIVHAPGNSLEFVADTFINQQQSALTVLGATTGLRITHCRILSEEAFSNSYVNGLQVSSAARFKIFNNKIDVYLGKGAFLQNVNPTGTDRSLFANNFIKSRCCGLEMQIGKRVDFLHNTIICPLGNAVSLGGAGTTSVIFKNNAVACPQSGGQVLSIGVAGISSDYNCLMTVSGVFAHYYQNGNHPNLAAWQAATPFDDHSISQNPLLDPQNEPLPTNPFLNAAAVPIAGIPEIQTDFFGNPRSAQPDMGCAEFTPPPPSPMCGVYKIGGTNPDFAGLSEAVSAVQYNGTSCPVTFDIAAGNYTANNLIVSDIDRQNPDDEIVFRRAPSTSSAPAISATYTIKLENERLVRFEGLNFSTAPSGWIFDLRGSARTTFVNCGFSSLNASGKFIFADNNSDSLHINNCVFQKGGTQIHLDGASPAGGDLRDVLIENSQFLGSLGEVVRGQGVLKNLIFRKNQVDATATGVTEIINNLNAGAGSYKILNNRFVMRSGTCIDFQGLASPSTERTLIANNFFSQPTPAASPFTLLKLVNCQRADVFHNSFNGDGNTDSNTWPMLYFESGGENRLKNNIIVCRGERPLLGAYETPFSEADYNCFFSNYQTLFDGDAGAASTLADWQAQTGFETNSIFEYPGFTSISELVPQAEAVDSAGQFIAGIPELGTDMFDSTRVSPPDIGAAQFLPNPVQPLCGNYSIGGASPDFATFSEAVWTLKVLGTSCPVTFDIYPGSYTGNVILQNIQKANADDEIVFRRAAGQPSINLPFLITVKQISDVSFRSLSIKQLVVDSSARTEVKKCQIGAAGILAAVQCLGDSDSLHIDSCTFVNFPTRCVHISGGTASAKPEGIVIENCQFQEVGQNSIFLRDSFDNLTIRRNVFQNSSSYFIYFFEATGKASIVDNKASGYHDNYEGRFVNFENCPFSGQRTLVANNHLTNLGFRLFNSSGVDFIHNTLSITLVNIIPLVINGGSQNRFFNNIVHTTVNLSGLPLLYVTSGAVLDMDYNNYFYASIPGTEFASGYQTFAAWQAATGFDAHSKSVNPFFVNQTTNLTPQNNQLEGEGLHFPDIPELATDFNGVPRNLPVDMGAIEFDPHPLLCGAYDIGGPSADFVNPNEAIEKLAAWGVGCPVIFNVHPGTASATQPINFPILRTNPADKVTFQGVVSGGARPIFSAQPWDFTGQNRLAFKDLRFDRINATHSANIELYNCQLSGNNSGYFVSGLCDSLRIDSCHFVSNANSIYFSPYQTGRNGVRIERCTLSSPLEKGIYLAGNLQNCLISNNYFSLTQSNSNGIFASNTSGGIAVVKNKFNIGSPSFGISVTHLGTASARFLVGGNTFSSQSGNVTSLTGNYIDFYQNSIRTGTPYPAWALTLNAGSHYRLKNNIVANFNTGMALSVANLASIDVSDHNDFYSGGEKLIKIGSTFQNSLADWQAASGKDSHSVSANPIFKNLPNAWDLLPNLVLLDSAGAATPEYPILQNDLEGFAQTSPPDIGARSFSPDGQPLCGIYTIGGTAPDFPNFSAAVDSIGKVGIGCEVVFHVRSGSYNDFINLGYLSKTAESQTVTFMSDPANTDTVILTNADSPVRISSSSGVKFKRIGFVKTSGTNIAAAMLNNAPRVEFDSCTFVQPSSNYCVQALGNCDSLKISNCLLTTCEIGVRVASGTSARITNVQLLENQFIDHTWGVSILEDCHNARIAGNRFVSNKTGSNYSNTGNSAVYANVYGPIKILNNRIEKTHGTGLLCWSANALIANNFVSLGTNAYKGMVVGKWDQSTANCNSDVLHNTVLMAQNPTTSAEKAAFHVFSDGVRLKNNLLAYFGTSPALEVGSYIGVLSDYNDLYVAGSILAKRGAFNYANLAAWRTASGQDLHSISVNPQMSATNPMQPTVALLDGAGVFVPGFPDILTDILGDTRNSPPDIGCLELDLAEHDLATTALISPVFGCSASGLKTISARLKNLGNALETGFQVAYSVNGNQISVETFNGPAIVPGDSAIFQFAQKFNFSGLDTVVLRVYVNRQNDVQPANDTLVRGGIAPPTLTLLNFTNSSCDASTGLLNFVAAGKTPFSFSIGSGAQATGLFANLSPGTYVATVTDAHGCTASRVKQLITVDNVAPVISGCPANQSALASCIDSAASVSWTPPTATDNCVLQNLTSSHAPGSRFPLGSTIVTYLATDSYGNTSACSFAVVVGPLAGSTQVWLGGTGDWQNPAKWSGGQVPSYCDTVVISSGVVNLLAPAEVKMLVFTGGKISGTDTLVALGQMIWSDATLAVPIWLWHNCQSAWQGGTMRLEKGLLNSGNINFAGGTLNFRGATLQNEGTFLVSSPTAVFSKTIVAGAPPSVFQNYGNLNFDASVSSFFTKIRVENYETLTLPPGMTLKIDDKFHQTGVLDMAVNSGLDILKDTTFFLEDFGTPNVLSGNNGINIFSGATLLGVGDLPPSANYHLTAGSGRFIVNYPAVLSGNASLQLDGGFLRGVGSLQIPNLEWHGGRVQLPLTVTDSGHFSGTSGFLEKQLTLLGDFNLDAGNIYLAGAGKILNQGQFYVNGNASSLLRSGSHTSQVFDNQGLLKKTSTAPTSVSNFTVPVTNASGGTVSGLGTFKFTSGLTNLGLTLPGDSTAAQTLRVENNWTNGNELFIHLFDTAGVNGLLHSALSVKGAATLGGQLTAAEQSDLPDGVYDIVTCGTPTGPACISGTFASTILPPGYSLVYLPKKVQLVKTTAAQNPRGGDSKIRVACRPNPFSGQALIDLELPETAAVRLEIFNGLGESVRSLLPETILPAGLHRFVWSADGLASGIYFVRVSGGDGVLEVLRVVLE